MGGSSFSTSSTATEQAVASEQAAAAAAETARVAAPPMQVQQPAVKQTEEIHQEFFVPLKNIGQVQKSALKEATAMAKMKDGHFEVVINIERFAPEEVKVFLVEEENTVFVVADKKEVESGTG